jgi:hypothetical protein
MRLFRILSLSILGTFLIGSLLFAQTGRIQGTVTDVETNEPLIGVNVIIEGTVMGAATNIEGYYSIINVPPGEHILRFSMIGYDPVRVENVRVSINQTTDIDVQLRSSAFELGEVVIIAQRPIVERDVSASTVNLSAAEVQNLPVVDISSVVGLQAGIQGLTVRGANTTFDPVAFMVDGLTLRDERDNQPYTNISFTSVEEIQIQTGGFNAEYGNVRSGIINVVTREGRRDRYTLDVLVRQRPPGPKHFGAPANDPNSYWIRPYVDDEVAWTGTKNGAWDQFQQRQYPEFEGWIKITEDLRSAGVMDITPEAAQQIFLWRHRKPLEITRPDEDIDVSFGGPLPLVSEFLGNARFHASWKQTREMLVIPLHTDSYEDYNAHAKITSDIGPGMKLMVQGMYGKQWGTNDNNLGQPGIFRSASDIGGVLNRVSYIDARIFTTDYWAPTTVIRTMIGGKFTHALSSNTFYEATLEYFNTEYDTNPGRMRNYDLAYEVAGVMVDEAPYGFSPLPHNVIGSGMRMGVGMSNSRDSTTVVNLSGKFDITSQFNRYNQVKAGFEFVYTDHNINYAQVDEYLPSGRYESRWRNFPLRGGLYVQNKTEFQGMIANLGVRIDYYSAQGDWYVYDPFDRGLANAPGLDTLLAKEPTDKIVHVSPRLGVSFPVTEDSKLYFNYGHFRQMPRSDDVFQIRRFSDTNALARIGDPNNPLQQTVAYELGYEHNLFDMFLLRVAGYYRDIGLQPRLTSFLSRDGVINYSRYLPNNYRDVRGFEITLTKRVGRWMSGFVNYTYSVVTFGNFGLANYYENPAEQRRYERTTEAHYQSRPVPEPYARANFDFYTPVDFGPEFAGMKPLGDWRLNLLGSWSSGRWFTWTGGANIPGISNNVQWVDYYNLNMRISKNFRLMGAQIQFFADITNVLNHKHMSTWGYGFVDGEDYRLYMESLHLDLDENTKRQLDYVLIPGSDRPGAYRKPGTEYQPMQGVRRLSEVSNPNPLVLYYNVSTGNYWQYSDEQGWFRADSDYVQNVLDNRAYIDMPNQGFLTFLNPRNIFFGIRLSIGL